MLRNSASGPEIGSYLQLAAGAQQLAAGAQQLAAGAQQLAGLHGAETPPRDYTRRDAAKGLHSPRRNEERTNTIPQPHPNHTNTIPNQYHTTAIPKPHQQHINQKERNDIMGNFFCFCFFFWGGGATAHLMFNEAPQGRFCFNHTATPSPARCRASYSARGPEEAPYVTQQCFRSGNRVSGGDFGRTLVGKASGACRGH